MYFTKVEFHNYGIYKGTHEMPLLNKIGNRNITLIGGLNGRGKTTFHDGILIALYGKQSLKYIQEKARSYEKLLANHMNNQATDPVTYVSVSITLDDETELQVKRIWTKKNNRIVEEVVVEKNGVVDKYLGESWSYYIEEILPFGIARFFFFNNEKITQLADDTSFEQIKSSIKSAIGVSTIERAIDHADEVIHRKKNALEAFETSELNQEYQEVERELTKNSQRLVEANKEAGELEIKCQDYAVQLEVKESEFWSSGGDLSKNREAIKAEMDKIKDTVKAVQQEIMQMVSDPATPLFLCKELVIQTFNSEKEHQNTEAKNYVSMVINESYQRIMDRLLETDIPIDVIQKINVIFNSELQRHRPDSGSIDRVNLSPSTMVLYEHLIVDVFASINERIIGLIQNAEAQESEYMSLDAHLGAADEKTMAMKLYEVLKALEQKKAVADSEYFKKLETIESLRRQREQLMSKRVQLIKGLAEKENSNDDNLRIIQYAAMTIEMLTEFKNRLQQEKVKKLSSTVTNCFKTLVEKESLVGRIEIDPKSLDVKIIDTEEKELLKEQLSAGEQQMFAISIVWALALTSGYKAPVIIDTPMARLDSSHRTNFVTKYLPAASSQVLVLSTDEEIYGRYLDMIRENVIDYYTLLYLEKEKCTTIIQGYFEEA